MWGWDGGVCPPMFEKMLELCQPPFFEAGCTPELRYNKKDEQLNLLALLMQSICSIYKKKI